MAEQKKKTKTKADMAEQKKKKVTTTGITEPKKIEKKISKSLIIEGFIVDHLIQEGGFAGVYVVKRVIDKQVLAVKILTPKATAQRSSRGLFHKEIRLMAKFDHPFIVKVFGALPQAPRPAMIMEYFASSTLHSLVTQKSPLLIEKGVGIFRKTAEALKYLHEKHKIIHKDIKPENILVNSDGDVRLIDFSIAEKMGFWSFLRPKKREGTPLYMSPEQIRRQNLDYGTDIYSLGATFYQVFSGRSHIKAESEKALLQQQLRAPVSKIRQFNKTVPYQLDNLLQRMLKKNPQDRYQSMAEVLFDLNRFSTRDHVNLYTNTHMEEDAEGS